MAEDVTGTVSPTPAAATFSGLKTKIARFVKMPNDPEALDVAADGMEDSIQRLNMRKWNINRKTSDITLTTNQKEYDLPADYLAVSNCDLLNSAPEIVGRLDYLTPAAFNYSFVDRSAASGTPTHFTVKNFNYNQKLTLSANPSASFTSSYPKLRLHYFSTFAYPSLSTDIISKVSALELFVTWNAMAYIATFYGSDAEVQKAEANAAQALQALIQWDDAMDRGGM